MARRTTLRIYMLSNLDKDGEPSGKHPNKGTLFWRTDGS